MKGTLGPATKNKIFTKFVKAEHNFIEVIYGGSAKQCFCWCRRDAGSGFGSKFLDESISAQYQQEHPANMIVQIVSGPPFLSPAWGLFGSATLAVVKHVKEISVRKVQGAGVCTIIQLPSKDFFKLVIISVFTAWPIAHLIISKWLQGFAHHVNILWWVFLITGICARLIAFSTASFQCIKAGFGNSVKSLKSE
jgi:putative ABC transport system permease protein